MDVIILSFITSAALSSLTGDDPTVPKLRVLEPSVTRAWPSVPSLVGSVNPENVNAPVISTASAIVILVESDESSVVPFTLKALIKTSPVPLGCILMSAFEPFDFISLVVRLFAVRSVAVMLPLKMALPFSLMSSFSAVIVEEPSSPFNSMSLLVPCLLYTSPSPRDS